MHVRHDNWFKIKGEDEFFALRKTCPLFSCETREREPMKTDNVDLCYKNFTIRITQRTVTEQGEAKVAKVVWFGQTSTQEISILKEGNLIEFWSVRNTDSLIEVIKKAKQYIDGIHAWNRKV